MRFNKKLISLRTPKGLNQEELGRDIGVSRRTISKWESAQSYPDFQRLVLLSDYFDMSLDTLAKDLEIDDVLNKNQHALKVDAIYDDTQNAKTPVNIILNAFAIFGLVGLAALFLIIFFLGKRNKALKWSKNCLNFVGLMMISEKNLA